VKLVACLFALSTIVEECEFIAVRVCFELTAGQRTSCVKLYTAKVVIICQFFLLSEHCFYITEIPVIIIIIIILLILNSDRTL
jgi:hypothetical protein